MNTLPRLLRDSQIGTWCKRAAWVILAIGLVQVACNILLVVQEQGFVSPLGGSPWSFNQWLDFLRLGLGPIPSILFSFFILYAAGAIVKNVLGESEAEEDELTVEEEEEDGMTPGQFTEASPE